MLDAIVGRLIRQYVAEGTCVWKDGGLLAENACLDAAQISDLFEGLAPGVLLPFTIELISVRRGVVSVPLGSILMWRQGNVEVQLEGVNVLLRQRRDDTVTKETIKRAQEQNIRGAMQQMRTLGGAKEEEVAGAPIPELLRRLIGLCRVKVSIKDVHFRYENLAQGDMEVEAGTSAHAAGAVLGRLDLVQDENSSLSGVGTLDLQVADLGAYLKPASHGGADHSASDLELAVGDPRSRRASAQREQEERARASSCSSEASEAAAEELAKTPLSQLAKNMDALRDEALAAARTTPHLWMLGPLAINGTVRVNITAILKPKLLTIDSYPLMTIEARLPPIRASVTNAQLTSMTTTAAWSINSMQRWLYKLFTPDVELASRLSQRGEPTPERRPRGRLGSVAAYHQGSAKDGLTASRKDTVEPVAAPRAGTPFAISEDSVSEGSVHPVLLQKLPAAPPKMSMSVPPSMQRRQSVMSQGMNPARQRWNTAIQAVSTMLGLLGVTKQSTSNFARLVSIKTSYIRNFQDLIAELPDTDTKVKYDYDYEAIVEARSRLPPQVELELDDIESQVPAYTVAWWRMVALRRAREEAKAKGAAAAAVSSLRFWRKKGSFDALLDNKDMAELAESLYTGSQKEGDFDELATLLVDAPNSYMVGMVAVVVDELTLELLDDHHLRLPALLAKEAAALGESSAGVDAPAPVLTVDVSNIGFRGRLRIHEGGQINVAVGDVAILVGEAASTDTTSRFVSIRGDDNPHLFDSAVWDEVLGGAMPPPPTAERPESGQRRFKFFSMFGGGGGDGGDGGEAAQAESLAEDAMPSPRTHVERRSLRSMIGGAAYRAAERKLAVKAEVHIPMSAPAGLRSGALEEALSSEGNIEVSARLRKVEVCTTPELWKLWASFFDPVGVAYDQLPVAWSMRWIRHEQISRSLSSKLRHPWWLLEEILNLVHVALALGIGGAPPNLEMALDIAGVSLRLVDASSHWRDDPELVSMELPALHVEQGEGKRPHEMRVTIDGPLAIGAPSINNLFSRTIRAGGGESHSVEAQLAKASATLAEQQAQLQKLQWNDEKGQLALAEFRAAAQVAALREWREERDRHFHDFMAEARAAVSAGMAPAAAARSLTSPRGLAERTTGSGPFSEPSRRGSVLPAPSHLLMRRDDEERQALIAAVNDATALAARLAETEARLRERESAGCWGGCCGGAGDGGRAYEANA